MTKNYSNSSPRQSKYFETLALLVASGSSIKEAIEQAGCSEHRAYQLSASQEFKDRVYAIRSETTKQAVGKLTKAVGKAIDKLVELLDSETESTVLNASKAILANLGPLCELGELRARLDAVEKQRPLRATA